MKYVKFVIVLLALSGCSYLGIENQYDDKSIVGKSVSQAIELLELDVGEYFVIQEPPGIPRGIYGKDKNGHKIELFVKRGDVPFSEKMDWKLEAFSSKTVIGIIRKTDLNNYSYGDMPFVFRR